MTDVSQVIYWPGPKFIRGATSDPDPSIMMAVEVFNKQSGWAEDIMGGSCCKTLPQSPQQPHAGTAIASHWTGQLPYGCIQVTPFRNGERNTHVGSIPACSTHMGIFHMIHFSHLIGRGQNSVAGKGQMCSSDNTGIILLARRQNVMCIST